MTSSSSISNIVITGKVTIETLCLKRGNTQKSETFDKALISFKKKTHNCNGVFERIVLSISDIEQTFKQFAWELACKKSFKTSAPPEIKCSFYRPLNFKLLKKFISSGKLTIMIQSIQDHPFKRSKTSSQLFDSFTRASMQTHRVTASHQIMISGASTTSLTDFIEHLDCGNHADYFVSLQPFNGEKCRKPSKKRLKTSHVFASNHLRRVPFTHISNWSSQTISTLTQQANLRILSTQQSLVLKKCIQRKNLFISGSAGTGKSFLIQQIAQLLGKVNDDCLNSSTIHITSTTGIGACGIGGVTIHSFAGINSLPPTTKDQIKFHLRMKPTLKKKWRKAKCIIIDEISMLDSSLWVHLDQTARIARGHLSSPFGGIQIIAIGDFCQLPPVSTKEKRKFAFQSESWRQCFHSENCIYLKKIFRQSHDSFFATILDRVRRGTCKSMDLRNINDRCVGRKFDLRDGILPTKIFTHKKDVDMMNSKMLNDLCKLSGKEKKSFIAKDNIISETYRSYVSDYPLVDVLVLAIGAQVIVTRNISKNLVNGTRGVVESFTSSGLPLIKFITADGKHMFQQVVDYSSYSNVVNGIIVTERKQLPLNLGWAISVHKSQGMTIPRIEADLSKAFEYGQIYVALSRAQSLSGLSLASPLHKKLPFCHPDVKKFYKF